MEEWEISPEDNNFESRYADELDMLEEFDKKGFTGYVQRVDWNRKSQQGFTYYFDIILQTAVDQTQMIRIIISSMDDTTKSQLFKDKQKAQQPITITNLRVVQSGMVFMHQNSIVKDVSTMAIPFKYVPPAAPPITSVADVLRTKR